MIKFINLKKEDKKLEKEKKTKWKFRSGIPLLLIFIILVVVGCLVWEISRMAGADIAEKGKNFFVGEEGKITTVTESVLEKSVKRSKMYTAEYPYNGYTAVYEDDQKTVKYYVAYEGMVKAGIDVSRIDVSLEKDTNTIFIRLPEVTVAEPWVNPGTMEYIFEDEKYNTETVAQEAYKAALADLAERASADTKLADTAAKTAKLSAKALAEPWTDQADGEAKYTINVLAYGEEEDE